MTRKRITIQLIGSPQDNCDVRLTDFIDQLARVKAALQETELEISGADKNTIDYKVVDLKHSSPARITIEPVPLNGYVAPGLINEVAQTFASELSTIKRKSELRMRPNLSRLMAYDKIGAQRHGQRQNRIETVSIKYDRKQVTVDEKFKKHLHAIIGPDEIAIGSISGMLEAINLHNTNRFSIYPTIGPKKVAGTFPPHLRAKVKQAIGAFVTVAGKVKYKAWAKFPHAVSAEEIDIHEPDDELPKLSEVRGIFAEALGDLNSVEFIEKLRDEDWR